jgi:hypothetical protein
MNPAIVIPAYNRPQALARLLSSLTAADYSPAKEVSLVISIDPENDGPNRKVREVSEAFEWSHGSKEILLHEEHLGLLGNFHFCGGLTERYGSAIFLEDDSVVSPVFYRYAAQALDRYQDEELAGGISLYRYAFNGYTHHSFEPLSDENDVFFMQLPSIMGQCWTQTQWEAYAQWRGTSPGSGGEALHEVWSAFPADDYFPILTRYLVSTGRFYVFPRQSLTTGFGDAGTHFSRRSAYFQVPLQRGRKSFALPDLHDSNAVYDSFMEVLPACLKRLAPGLTEYDFCMDLSATKKAHHLTTEHVVTIRACRKSERTYALAMHPPEANLIHNAEGTGINLCRAADVRWGWWSDLQARVRLHDYFSRGRHSLKQLLVYGLLGRLRSRS